MQHTRTRRAARRAGFGLLEVVISGTILFLLAASMVEAVRQVGALGRMGGTVAKIQQDAQDALSTISRELRDSGFVTTNGKTYPFLFTDGEAGVDFAPHEHAPAVENARSDEPDFGPNREIVFVRPSFREVVQDSSGLNWELFDENGDALSIPSDLDIVKRYAFPDIGNAGVVGFDPEEISFVVVTAADGVNELQRRRNGGSPVTLARGVERLVFDTSGTDPVGVPVGAVRVRLWLRAREEGGTVHRHFVETVVRLQNRG